MFPYAPSVVFHGRHQAIEQDRAYLCRGLDRLIAKSAGLLDEARARFVRELFDRAVDRFVARADDPRGLTLTHGDLNPGNLLVPRDGRGPILLIDRQPFEWSAAAWLGASDLVNASVPWWDPGEARADIEAALLHGYHAALLERGVRDYPFEQLLHDYRSTLVMALGVAAGWCVDEEECDHMQWLWRQQLVRALAVLDRHAPNMHAI